MSTYNVIDVVAQFMTNELEDDTDHEIMLMLIEEERRRQRSLRNEVPRDRVSGYLRLFKDYFAEDPVYTPNMFRRRFRMGRELFLRIVRALGNHSSDFQMRSDASRRQGVSPLQKCTAAIRQLAYGTPPDSYDEYLRLGETTAKESLYKFCRGIIEVFGERYLRRPNTNDVQRLFNIHAEKHGFPGMLGSLDCMHWAWTSCPVAWAGQFTRGDQGCPTIMLEAVASNDLWIWHAYFGVAGSNNDINVLNQSPLFNDVLQGFAPPTDFTVSGTQYKHGYYLVDGIYPEWASFVKSFSHAQDPKRILFKQKQESARKDVERAFGVLQSRWAIIRGPCRIWHRRIIKDIMYACIILHNMIVEDEGAAISEWSDEGSSTSYPVNHGSIQQFRDSLQRHAELRNNEIHHQLRADLVHHIWQKYGGNED